MILTKVAKTSVSAQRSVNAMRGLRSQLRGIWTVCVWTGYIRVHDILQRLFCSWLSEIRPKYSQGSGLERWTRQLGNYITAGSTIER